MKSWMFKVDCRSSCDARFALDPAGGRCARKGSPYTARAYAHKKSAIFALNPQMKG
jgi:hypothetical protein